MKMKYLVLGVSCLALCASTAWAKPKILDGSLVGWWRFDNPSNYKEDSSGYGSSINSDISNGTLSSSGGYSGGKINLAKSKKFTATLADAAPAIPGTSLPYYTMAARFKSGGSIGGSGDVGSVLNDTKSWHFGAIRYQNSKTSTGPNTGGKDPYAIFLDPQYNVFGTYERVSSGDLEITSSTPGFILSYSDKTVTIGGSIKVGWSSVSWYGDIDEVMAFSRMLTKGELTRLRFTGESYVFSNSEAPAFASSANWSCNEGSVHFAPGDAYGAPYIVEDGQTMSQGGTATFGGDVAKHVSLTLGRPAEVTYMEGSVSVTKGINGNFDHSSAGTLTFYDLRLVNGKFTGVAGGVLNTALLDIDTPSGSMFEINVPSGVYTITSANAVTGDGTLKKTGAGTLDLTGLTGAAKVVVTEGKVLAGPNVTVSYDLAEDRGAVPVLMVE